jgi:hypothetical protein
MRQPISITNRRPRESGVPGQPSGCLQPWVPAYAGTTDSKEDPDLIDLISVELAERIREQNDLILSKLDELTVRVSSVERGLADLKRILLA